MQVDNIYLKKRGQFCSLRSMFSLLLGPHSVLTVNWTRCTCSNFISTLQADSKRVGLVHLFPRPLIHCSGFPDHVNILSVRTYTAPSSTYITLKKEKRKRKLSFHLTLCGDRTLLQHLFRRAIFQTSHYPGHSTALCQQASSSSGVCSSLQSNGFPQEQEVALAI